MEYIIHHRTFRKLLQWLLPVVVVLCGVALARPAHAVNYSLSLPTNDTGKYVLTDTANTPLTTNVSLPDGDTFQFKVEVAAGLVGRVSGFKVYQRPTSNPSESALQELTAAGGVYTVTLNQNLTIVVRMFCEVSFSAPDEHTAYTVERQPQGQAYGATAVPMGSSYSFTVTMAPSYLAEYKIPVVSLNGTELAFTTHTGINRRQIFEYKIPVVNENITLMFGNSRVAYIVTVPESSKDQSTGEYKYYSTPTAGDYFVAKDENFSFTLEVNTRYGGTTPKVSIAIPSFPGGTLGHTKVGNFYNYTIQNVNGDTLISVDDALWSPTSYTVRVTQYAEKYTVTPQSASVEHSKSFTFTIVPTQAYQNNTSPPVVRVGIDPLNPSNVATGGWAYTVLNVTKNVDVSVDVSAWIPGDNLPVNKLLVNIPTGLGYSLANVAGGTSTGGVDQYIVDRGESFRFSVNVAAGYDPTSLQVFAGSKKLTATNGVYLIENVQSNQTVTISVNKLSSATPTPVPGSVTPTPTPTSSATPSNATPTPNPEELTHYELKDTKTGIVVAGFFLGAPKLVITELSQTDRVYARMLKSSGVGQGNVLRAVDIAIVGGTYYGNLTVGLNVGVGYNTTRLRVVHGTNTGDELYDVTATDGMANVVVRGLSPYMVVDPYGTIVNTGTTSGSGTATNMSGTLRPPRTDYAYMNVGFIVLGVVAVVIVGIIWYKKKRDNA